ncbi:MAG: AsnC family transcriptional regulator [Nitrospira sp. BO4]|jgi:RNA polymerase sigma factor (sigma-70 family)|nr:AsnC family transcriptional regulator [Nitrospira sp. BO4]
MSASDLTRFDQFLAIPPEDIRARAKLALSRSDLDCLHTCAVMGEVNWDYYRAVNNAWKADLVYRHDGLEHGWSVAFIREQISQVTYSQYALNGEDVQEWIYGRIFPRGQYIRRIRTQHNPLNVIDELELALPPETDLEGVWKQQQKEFELEGIQLIQHFPDNQFVQEICFLPGDQNFTVRVVFSAGKRRKELIFPIALRYRPLLKSLEKAYSFDDTRPIVNPKEPLQRASTEELQEALLGLWCAVRDYDSSKDLSVPGYIKQQVTWHMGDVYVSRSEVIEGPFGEPQRVLKSEIERSGGSLDDSIPSGDEGINQTLGDTLPDLKSTPPDANVLLAQIIDSLVDEVDRQIIHLMRQEIPQKEIAKQLKMSQSAISQRLNRMRRHFSS